MINLLDLDHLRPTTLAQLIAELIVDHTTEDDTGAFNFHTEAAGAAYADLLAAGRRRCGEDGFHILVEIAVDREFAKER